MDISGLSAQPFKNLQGFIPAPPARKNPVASTDDSASPETTEDAASAVQADGEQGETTLEQYMAEIMADLFSGFSPEDDIFERIRKIQDETIERVHDKTNKSNAAPGPSAADPGAAPPAEVPGREAATEKTFSLDISIRSVFERVEELVRHTRSDRGGKVLETTSSVLERRAAGLDLDFSFTTRFLDQGIDLAEIDEELIDPFLDAVAGLADLTDDSLKDFLDATESLFNGLEDEFNLTNGHLQGTEDLFKKMATRFFDSVREIIESPTLLDREGRRKVLDIPPNDEFYRKRVADIFAEAGGFDAARRIVGGQPSDTEILLEGMKKTTEKKDETKEAGKKKRRKKKSDAAGDAEPVSDDAPTTAEDDAVDFAAENFKAVASGLTSQSLFRAAEFFQAGPENGPGAGQGRFRDITI